MASCYHARMKSSHPPSPPPSVSPSQDEARDLAEILQLQRDLKGVGSLERLLHVTLRVVASRLRAQHAVALVLDRKGEPIIVHQIGEGPVDLQTGRLLLGGERPARDTCLLYSILKENDKSAAVLMLRRAQEFSRDDLRTLQRLTDVANEAADHLAATRVRDVLARIDRKISQQLQTKDLLYQILDGLRILLRFDHSASILLLDTERSQLVVSAEKITWRKLKSRHIHDCIAFGPEISDALAQEGLAFVLDSATDTVSVTMHALWDPSPPQDVDEDDLRHRLQALYPCLAYGSRNSEGPREQSMLITPLLFGTRLLGLLKLSSQQSACFTASDVSVVGQFIEKMSTAIRNARLYERRLDELNAINEIGRLVTQRLPIEETCERILDIVLKVMNLRVGSIELLDVDRGRLRFLASRGYPLKEEGLALGEGITGQVASTNKPIVANDVSKEPHYVARFADVLSELAVPITFEGVCRGVLNVESYSRNRFQQRDVDFLSILADKTATALETIDQRDHRRATLRLLYELSAKLAVPETVSALANLTVELTQHHLRCEAATLFLFEDGCFRKVASAGVPVSWFADEHFHTGEGLTGQAAVLKTGSVPTPVIDNHVSESGRALPRILERYREQVGSGRIAHLIAVPLVDAGEPIGILRVINRINEHGQLVDNGFNKTEITLIQTIASQVSTALANSRKRERIRQLGQRLESQVAERTAEVHRLALFVEKAPVSIFSVDATGRLDFINQTGERVFGCKAAELEGRTIGSDGSGLLGEHMHDIESVVNYLGNWTGEVEARRVDGQVFPALVSVQRLTTETGQPNGIVVFARDITAMKELEHQLVASEGKRAMADLAGGVAHDLNNALGSSLPLIQALKADVEAGEIDRTQFLEDLEQIESYTRLSVRIFKGMLTMARGTFTIDQEVVINEPLTTAIDLLGFRLEKAHVTVERRMATDLPRMLAHPGRLEQAFHNVLSNAIEAMPEGGTLTCETRRQGDRIVVAITDTGTGIPENLLSRVEEPFYTSKRHGTGLGLSVVRSIVWEHNGKMQIRSRVGKGTTVLMEFPLVSLADRHSAGLREDET
jgi:PAS domain S-box-containing protein